MFVTPVLFRFSFDRRKFLTFGYRELLKVENFRQMNGLTFDYLGSVRVKAASKMLVKLTPNNVEKK